MKCIIGLGNPGKKYEKTRHNIGFMVIEELENRLSFGLNKHKFKCDYEIETFNGEKILFVRPQTFMNLSGEGVKPLLDYYKVEVDHVLVIYDDLDLPVGKIRLRQKGGHGGHNGIRSLIDHLGTKDFKRLRIGIGRPTDRTPVVNYVLQPFSQAERTDVEKAIQKAADACEAWFTKPFDEVINNFNR